MAVIKMGAAGAESEKGGSMRRSSIAVRGGLSGAACVLAVGLIWGPVVSVAAAQPLAAHLKGKFLGGVPIVADSTVGDAGSPPSLATELAAVQAGRGPSESADSFLERIGRAALALGLTAKEEAAVKALYGGRVAAARRAGMLAEPARMPPGMARAVRAHALEIAEALGTGAGAGALATGADGRVPLPGQTSSGAAARASGSAGLDSFSPPPPEIAEATRLLVNNPDPLQSCRWLFFCKNEDGVRYMSMSALGRFGGLFLGKGSSKDLSTGVSQGQLGDCYYLAALGAIAQSHPNFLRRMLHRNLDGTFTATFYRPRLPWEFWKPDFEPIEVRVDDEIPAQPLPPDQGLTVYATSGRSGPDFKDEIWPMVAEKAFALYHGGYDAINGGAPDRALEEITGRPSRVYAAASVTAEALARWETERRAVLASTKWAEDSRGDPLYAPGLLVPGHAYWVKSVDRRSGMITLANPWGYQNVALTVEQFRRSLDTVYLNGVTGP